MRKIVRRAGRIIGKTLTLGLKTGPHISRYSMYGRIGQFHDDRPPEARALSISGSEALSDLLGYAPGQVERAVYPDEDILNLSHADGTFDCLVADQVLEHIKGDPHQAIAESFRVVKPGGLVLHTTCFIQPIHRYPVDLWRFSPEALSYLVEDHGEVLDVGGWGNLFAWPYILTGMRFLPIPHARWHPFHWIATWNTPNWPIVTWVLATKKAD